MRQGHDRSIRLSCLAVLLLSCAVGRAALAQEAGGAAGQSLTLFTWYDYMDPALIDRFAVETGIRVEEVNFESPDERERVMAETDGRGFDLVLIDQLVIQSYIAQGWLAELDTDRMGNLAHIDPRWWGLVSGSQAYVVPYFWGTLGIAYRSDLVAEPITSWHDLLVPPDSLHGRIIMVPESHGLTGAALLALGFSPNSADDAELDAAEALLHRQKPHVLTYANLPLDGASPLVTGEAYATMQYSGEIYLLQQYEAAIRYALPREGTLIWVDYLAILNTSPHKQAAMAFIDFLNEPHNAAQLAQHVFYATPNRAAEALLPPEFLADEVIYPPAEILERSELYDADLPAAAIRRRAEIVSRLMR